MTARVRIEEAVLHGHRIRYRIAGRGPTLLLLHGIAGSSQTWEQVMPRLARERTVVAPDLLGHGESAKPRGDYSLGAYASGVRDLMTLLGKERVTVVGHSLGGGVAMQYAYQFPERVDRMVLVASGGLGREVSVMLRAATLPGAELVLPALFSPPLRTIGVRLIHALQRLGVHGPDEAEELAAGFESLGDFDSRQAFLCTLRGIIDPGGQRVSARDRLYLSADLPSLLVWGDRDRVIPVRHGMEAHAEMPGSRLEILRGAGHFPHRDQPERFTQLLLDFLATTRPAHISMARMRRRVRERSLAAS